MAYPTANLSIGVSEFGAVGSKSSTDLLKYVNGGGRGEGLEGGCRSAGSDFNRLGI